MSKKRRAPAEKAQYAKNPAGMFSGGESGGGSEGHGLDSRDFSSFCKTRTWAQDPTTGLGVRDAIVTQRVMDGPRTRNIILGSMPRLPEIPRFGKDRDGNLLFDPETDTVKFDATQALTVVSQVRTMWSRAIARMRTEYGIGGDFKLNWQWGSDPITVFPYGMIEANAYYRRHDRRLVFGIAPYGRDKIMYTCRSLDIIAHETGHAILDGLKPDYLHWYEGASFHESFGDLSAIFYILSKFDMIQKVITESKGDLSLDIFLPKLAEEFGRVISQRRDSLRDANNDDRMPSNPRRVPIHTLSKVFTGAVYNLLKVYFARYTQPDRYDLGVSLLFAAQRVQGVLLNAIHNTRVPTFASLAQAMYDIEPKADLKAAIRSEFGSRGIAISPGLHLAAAGAGAVASAASLSGTEEFPKDEDLADSIKASGDTTLAMLAEEVAAKVELPESAPHTP